MAHEQEDLRKKIISKGVTSKDKGTSISPAERLPYEPKNLFRSKKEFVEAEKIRKEKALKLKEAAAEFDREHGISEEEPKVEVKEEPKKPMGRPKKIE